MEVKILKPLMTATCLILAALLASPAAAKDYNSLNDYTAGRAPYVSASIADATGTAVNDGRTWLAIKTIPMPPATRPSKVNPAQILIEAGDAPIKPTSNEFRRCSRFSDGTIILNAALA
jgi:hypothetical protein